MIISNTIGESLGDFENLCIKTQSIMNQYAARNPDYFLSRGAQKLEPEVKKAMEEAAVGTKFEHTIEMISGQRFPDIVAAKYYGVEVKSTKENKWKVTGGSVAEGTRIQDVEHIFILFGKLHKPVEFKMRRYQDCLYDIGVTHSPRYKIDMDLPRGETIFDKMGINYDELRQSENPLDAVVKYFRSTLKPGESSWWINGEDASVGDSPAKIRMWKTLSKEEKDEIRAEAFAFFPELFSNHQNKYERFTMWLVANYGVISSSMRDPFSAGGQKTLILNGKTYDKVPRKLVQLYLSREKVASIICETEDAVIYNTWNTDQIFSNRMKEWVRLVSTQAESDTFDMKELLTSIFGETE